MTAEQIDRIEAGRDADTLVAERLPMAGVEMERVPWEHGTRRPFWRYDSAGYRERFQPTTDDAAAALVIQSLPAGCEVSSEQTLEGWDCIVTCDGHRIEARAATPELAACKAALLVALAMANEAAMPRELGFRRRSAAAG